jgi:hypothetical protein
MGNPDLSGAPGGDARRGLVIFPAEDRADRDEALAVGRFGDWWLVLAAVAVAAAMVGIALLVR